MNKTTIIIPSRLNARRLPNKPLKLINNKEMILHVYEAAVSAGSGEVFVATPNQNIVDVVKKFGGKAIKTIENHETGTDRVFEVFKKHLNSEPDIIINLQGDMPNIKGDTIADLIEYMKKDKCDIGTLASDLNLNKEINNANIVKVVVEENLHKGRFLKAIDFFRKNNNAKNYLYHHVGIYAFTSRALMMYVNLKRSKLELERKLEQLRALENDMSIHVGYINSCPLSVDTEDDLIEIKKVMEKNEKN